MSNTDTPFGLKPVRHAKGGVVRSNAYGIASALAANIFTGDPVIPVNTSKRITIAAAGNQLIGVFAGVSYVDSLGDVQIRPYWATGTTLKSGTTAEATVYDDPDILFAVQGDEDIVADDIGQAADVVIGSGNTSTGQSTTELDSSLITTSGQLRLEELWKVTGNEYGNFAKALVRISEHYLAGQPLTLI
jgi:hypothetical protein